MSNVHLTYCCVLLVLPCNCLQSGFPVKTLYAFLVTPHPSHILSSSSPTFCYSGLRNLLKIFHLRNTQKYLLSLGFLCPHMTLITFFFQAFVVYVKKSSFTDEICTLVGYYASSSSNFLPTFWDNLSVPFSGVKNPIKRR